MAQQSSTSSRKSAAAAGAFQVVREEIAKVAYELFERRGRSSGRDLEDWLEAEQIVRQRRRNGR